MFPFVGLYAFYFVWVQFMLGSNMYWMRAKYPWLLKFHRFEGGMALLFALLHPTLLVLSLGISEYYKYDFVAQDKLIYVWIGYLQLLLIMCTAGTALLRRVIWLKDRWYFVHYANYLMFALVWVHSWNLGSNVQGTSLQYLWYFYGLTAIASVLVKLARGEFRSSTNSSNKE
jgi:DMSO/TMAO reductase YedYZ heme-binding membrane subunit